MLSATRLPDNFEMTSDIALDGTLGLLGGIWLLTYPIPPFIFPQFFTGDGVLAVSYNISIFGPFSLLLFGNIGLYNIITSQNQSVQTINLLITLGGFIIFHINLLLFYIVQQGELTISVIRLQYISLVMIGLGTAAMGLMAWRSNSLPFITSWCLIITITGYPISIFFEQFEIVIPFTPFMIIYGIAWIMAGNYLRNIDA